MLYTPRKNVEEAKILSINPREFFYCYGAALSLLNGLAGFEIKGDAAGGAVEAQCLQWGIGVGGNIAGTEFIELGDFVFAGRDGRQKQFVLAIERQRHFVPGRCSVVFQIKRRDRLLEAFDFLHAQARRRLQAAVAAMGRERNQKGAKRKPRPCRNNARLFFDDRISLADLFARSVNPGAEALFEGRVVRERVGRGFARGGGV
ncbi:MAG: hypothetical protein IKC51_06595 [Myxococcaceae bacterium]|nr:hypothetical protein [Myxococcaceae bacterium]